MSPRSYFAHWSAVSHTGSSSGHVIALGQSGAFICPIRADFTTVLKSKVRGFISEGEITEKCEVYCNKTEHIGRKFLKGFAYFSLNTTKITEILWWRPFVKMNNIKRRSKLGEDKQTA